MGQGIGQGGDAIRPRLESANVRKAGLFDRHREPSDQSCHLVQMLGIAGFNLLRQPHKTFVVAQGRNVAGNDRGHWPDEDGLDVWHRITSWRNPAPPNSSENASFWCTMGGTWDR